jgi:hypothetical protein
LQPQLTKASPLLFIDACLADNPLAIALQAVNYNAIACNKQFPNATPDPTIIQWLALQGGIWITADEKAKRQHALEIKKAGVHVIWIKRSKNGMNAKNQLLLILWIIDPILQEISRAKRPCYFIGDYNGLRPRYMPC